MLAPHPIRRSNLFYFFGKQGCTWSCTCNPNQADADPLTPIDLNEYSIHGSLRTSGGGALSIGEFFRAKIKEFAGKLITLEEVVASPGPLFHSLILGVHSRYFAVKI